MKKIMSVAFVSLAAYTFVACGALLGSNNSNKAKIYLTPKERKVIGEFSEIGKEHNSLLADFYGMDLTENRSAVVKNTPKDFDDYFQIDENTISVFSEFSYGSSESRSASQEKTILNLLADKVELDSAAKEYALKIERLLLSESDAESVEDLQNSITYVEKEAIANLEGDALVQFMSYAETAKASLEFWNAYYNLIDDSSTEKARGLFSFIKAQLNKIKWAAASDAAGAAAGAIAGAVIGSAIPGVGTAASAAAGAAVAGAASSAEGYRTGKLCVVVSPTDIQKKLR